MAKVAVIGAGTMGNGIAQVFAASSYEVALIDTKEEFLRRGIDHIRSSLGRIAKKGGLAEAEAAKIVGRIVTSTAYEAARGSEIAIEAVFEDEGVKKEVFKRLDEVTPPTAILCTNTSSIPITSIAAATRRPAKVAGMHFFNPVPVMKLVEVVRGQETSAETVAAVRQLAEKLGKVPVEARDYPGFVSNRILMPMLNEAFCALMEGVSTREGIDTVMKLGMAHPMGPLELADFIGLDVCLDILEVLQRGFGDPKYRPCPLLRRMVAAGRLGRKSGKGFYDYPGGGTDFPNSVPPPTGGR